jgi:ribosomal protein L40E
LPGSTSHYIYSRARIAYADVLLKVPTRVGRVGSSGTSCNRGLRALTEQLPRRCRFCDKEVAAGVSECPSCGTKLDDSGPAPPIQGKAADDFVKGVLDTELPGGTLPEIKSTCPFCAAPVDDSQTKCPRCGVALKVVIARPWNMFSCPECGALSPSNAKNCVKCGVLFANEMVASVPAPTVTAEVPKAEKESKPPVEIHERITPLAPTKTGGLTNGRGAVNGTATSRSMGAINGTGIVNGTGVTNGMGPSSTRGSRPERRASAVKSWQFLAILVAVIVIIPMFLFMANSHPAGLAVDGKFGDWSDAQMFGMQTVASSPEIAVQEWSVQKDGNSLYVYFSVEGNLMGSSNVDSYYLFIDSDDTASTGYSVNGMGADYVISIDGWDGQVQSTSIMKYGSSIDKLDWNSWDAQAYSVTASMAQSELEAKGDLPVALGDEARFLLLSQTSSGQDYSVSYSVPGDGGVLIASLEPGGSIDKAYGTVPSGMSVSFATLKLTCEGIGGTVTSITPSILDASLATVFDLVELIPGQEVFVGIQLDTRLAPEKNAVSVIIDSSSFASSFKDIVILNDTVSAYAVSAPSVIEIDGAFGDWLGRLTPDNDSSTIQNPNINVTSTGFAEMTSSVAFYVSVEGNVFEGTWVPASKAKPTGGGGGGGGGTTPRASGEDFLRVYIDSDLSNTTGLTVSRSGKVIGADYMIEMRGSDGNILSKRILKYDSMGWVLMSGQLTVAKDAQRMEFSVPILSIGGNSSFATIIETTDWKGRSDWAWITSIPDPWVITGTGMTYQSDTGALWNFIGVPTLAPGDHIVDIAMTTDDKTVVIVTNTGRTYYWTLASAATNWTAGETTPIDTANYSEAVSMSFFSKTGAWLLTKNGSYFYLMDAITPPSNKEWTFQSPALVGVTDFVDLEYEGGTMYALRGGANTRLNFSLNGNTFTSVTNQTGSTSIQCEVAFIPGAAGSADDRLFVLCENGNIRYSADGGQTWSAWGNLPTPGGGNTTKYVGIGIDSTGYMWVVTDTGYTFLSTDATTYSTFNCTGQAPATGIVAVIPLPLIPTGIPEFQYFVIPVLGMTLIALSRRFKKER